MPSQPKAQDGSTKRASFLEFFDETEAFANSYMELLGRLHRRAVHQSIPERNTERYNHGKSWTHRANPEIPPGEMQTMSTTLEVKFQKVIDGDLSTIATTLSKATKEMEEQFSRSLYSMLSDTCERTGNTVSVKDAGSFAAGFLEMFRKIELGVDREGKVSLPELRVGTDPQKLIDELKAQPPEFHQEFERLKNEKAAAALEREAARKARFRRYDS